MRTRSLIFKTYINAISRSPTIPILFSKGSLYMQDTGFLRIGTEIDSDTDFVFPSAHLNTMFRIKNGHATISGGECKLSSAGRGIHKSISFPVLSKSKLQPFDIEKMIPDDSIEIVEESKQLYREVIGLLAASRVGNGRFYGIYKIPQINGKKKSTVSLCASGNTSFIFYRLTDLEVPEVSLSNMAIADIFRHCETIRTFTRTDKHNRTYLLMYFKSEEDDYEGIIQIQKPSAIPNDWIHAMKWIKTQKPVISFKMNIDDFSETIVEMTNTLSKDNQLSTGENLTITIEKNKIIFKSKAVQGTIAYTIEKDIETTGKGSTVIKNFTGRGMRYISSAMLKDDTKKKAEYLTVDIFHEDKRRLMRIQGENGLSYLTVINDIIYT
jgi:hypothetical protein